MSGWWNDAACRGLPVDLFFVDPPAPEAALVCRTCPVAVACDRDAEAGDVAFGVFGGLTPAERVGVCATPGFSDEPRTGTMRGASAHRQAGERLCRYCRDAERDDYRARVGLPPHDEPIDRLFLDWCELPTAGHPRGRRGTIAGRRAHLFAGAEPCEPCAAAHADDVADRRARTT